MLGLHFDPEDRYSRFLRNVCKLVGNVTSQISSDFLLIAVDEFVL